MGGRRREGKVEVKGPLSLILDMPLRIAYNALLSRKIRNIWVNDLSVML